MLTILWHLRRMLLSHTNHPTHSTRLGLKKYRYNLRLGALAQSCKRKFYNASTVCKPSSYHYQLPQRLHCVSFHHSLCTPLSAVFSCQWCWYLPPLPTAVLLLSLQLATNSQLAVAFLRLCVCWFFGWLIGDFVVLIGSDRLCTF